MTPPIDAPRPTLNNPVCPHCHTVHSVTAACKPIPDAPRPGEPHEMSDSELAQTRRAAQAIVDRGGSLAQFEEIGLTLLDLIATIDAAESRATTAERERDEARNLLSDLLLTPLAARLAAAESRATTAEEAIRKHYTWGQYQRSLSDETVPEQLTAAEKKFK